jgi:hypothetical protein
VLVAALFAVWLPTSGLARPDLNLQLASWFTSASWFDGRSHLGTGKVYVRFDRSRLSRGALFLDDVDLKSSSTGIIVRDPGVISLRSSVPGMLHNWYPTEYCKIVVHPNAITVLDVQLNGRIERNGEGALVTRPVCKCMIQAVKDKSNDADEIPTCE